MIKSLINCSPLQIPNTTNVVELTNRDTLIEHSGEYYPNGYPGCPKTEFLTVFDICCCC